MAKRTQAEDAGKKYDAAKKAAIRLEKAIEDSAELFEGAASEVSAQIATKEEALRKELSEANATLAKLKQDLNSEAGKLWNKVYTSLEQTRRKNRQS